MLQRYLDPQVLAGISGLELVARTVVDGFIAGMHRSPDFGFSQEFAEYRAYTPGDDLRHIDWNLYARSERLYLKRYKGETNTQLMVLLDASKSMGFASTSVSKLDYAKFLSASLCYFAGQQRDAAGLTVFDEDVRNYVVPSARQGQLVRLLHGIEQAAPSTGERTDFAKPFYHYQQFHHRRGIAAVISDFWADPETIVRSIEPLRHHGTDVVLFHVLDPEEIRPKFDGPVVLIDMESNQSIEVSPDYAKREYPAKIDAHIVGLKSKANSAGLDYFLIDTSRPLDAALREYFMIRRGRL